jgi:Protein of unknown function (DUF2934)
MPNLEEAIRERAYHLWVADGQPPGRADTYWLNAQREVLAASVESSVREAEAALTEMVVMKLARKRRIDRGFAWRKAAG